MSSTQISSSSSDSAPAHAAPDDSDLLLPMLGDVTCRVSVRLGTAVITVRDCLRLAPATVIRLDQHAGDDVDVQVHGSVIAQGEVEVLDTKSSVRLTTFHHTPSNQVSS